jgi:phospholipase A-2-activating protein
MGSGEASEPDRIYHLLCSLAGHSEDVRCLVTAAHGKVGPPKGCIVSGSRDKTTRYWPETETTEHYSLDNCIEIKGHADYVTAVALTENEVVVSGSRDATLCVWRVAGGEAALQTVLSGHQYQVTGVVVLREDENGHVIASTSLDGSVRLWKVDKGMAEMSGSQAQLNDHEGPVLCCCVASTSVVNADESLLATGSGDCTLRLWTVETGNLGASRCEKVFRGHTDTVRSVAYIPSVGLLVSGSHDTSVKIWTLDGDCVQSLEGHEALVYSVNASPDGSLIASGSEDKTVKVWNLGGECVQTIPHPGCVWAVAFLQNGDLVTGCADGVIRVWSCDQDRKAPDDIVAAFEVAVAASQNPNSANAGASTDQGMDSGKKMKMYDPSKLGEPGAQDGQTIVVNEGSCGTVYSWNQQAGEWEKVGEVVMEGAETFDFNFDVDIADNLPKLKLRANIGDDAYEVADRFIAEHNLPTSYKEQIVQFLISNTGGRVNINLDTSGSFVDPYTGSNAYLPDNRRTASTTNDHDAVYPGPSINVDPFTGSEVQASGLLPLKGYTVFSASLAADNALKKLRELNPTPPSDGALVSEDEWNQVCSLMHDASPNVSAPAIQKILSSWDIGSIFPIIDAFRALLTTAPGRSAMMALIQTIHPEPPPGSLGAVIEGVFQCQANPSSKATVTVMLRFLANLFDVDLIAVVIAPNVDYLVGLVKDCAGGCVVKGIANAYTTFLTNVAVYLQKVPNASSSSSLAIALQACNFIIQGESSSSPGATQSSLKNALLVIGTLRRESLIKPSDVSIVTPAIKRLAEDSRDQSLQLVAREVSGYF